jgi:hypothetical protein
MAYRPLSVLAWLAALAALLLLAFVGGVLGESVALLGGLLLICAGLGFVLAPLLRRRAGRGTEGDRHPWRRRSFRLGLAATLAGLAVTVLALWRLIAAHLPAS